MIALTVGDLLEQIRPWVSPVALVAILGVVSRHYLLTKRVNIDARKMEAEVEGDLRDDYAAAVRSFREEVASLKEDHRRDMEEMRRRNEDCDADRDKLREQVLALRNYAEGLYRVILQNSASGALALGEIPDEIQRAAERVNTLFKERSPHGRTSGQDSGGTPPDSSGGKARRGGRSPN